MANEKLLTALFSEDAVKNRRNTEAIEIAPNTLLAARVLEHVPAARKPFDAVKADIEKLLKAQEAASMAKSAGEASLAELEKGGEDKLAWSPVKSVSRMQSRELLPATVQAIFKAGVEKLPAYVGNAVGGDYVLYKIVKVNPLQEVDIDKRKGLQGEYAAIVAQQDLSGLSRRAARALQDQYQQKRSGTQRALVVELEEVIPAGSGSRRFVESGMWPLGCCGGSRLRAVMICIRTMRPANDPRWRQERLRTSSVDRVATITGDAVAGTDNPR